MNNVKENLTIGGLAAQAGVNVETIRYYQRRGLLFEPERPVGGIRRYARADVERLTFVKTAQSLGFSLDEIEGLLRLEDGAHCLDASGFAEQKLADVRDKISGLQRIERVLGELIHRCHERSGEVSCPLIGSLQTGLQDMRAETNTQRPILENE